MFTSFPNAIVERMKLQGPSDDTWQYVAPDPVTVTADQRVVTRSDSAIWSSTVTLSSPNADSSISTAAMWS